MTAAKSVRRAAPIAILRDVVRGSLVKMSGASSPVAPMERSAVSQAARATRLKLAMTTLCAVTLKVSARRAQVSSAALAMRGPASRETVSMMSA